MGGTDVLAGGVEPAQSAAESKTGADADMTPTSPDGNEPDLHLEIAGCDDDLADDLAGALDRIEAFLEQRQAAPRLLYAVRLVVEELVTNTIKYGYDDTVDDCAGEHRISIAFTLGPPATLRIEDDGHLFDPLEHAPVAETDAPVEDRPIGGLGLHMVRSQAASMRYRRVNGINRLDIVFPP